MVQRSRPHRYSSLSSLPPLPLSGPPPSRNATCARSAADGAKTTPPPPRPRARPAVPAGGLPPACVLSCAVITKEACVGARAAPTPAALVSGTAWPAGAPAIADTSAPAAVEPAPPCTACGVAGCRKVAAAPRGGTDTACANENPEEGAGAVTAADGAGITGAGLST